MELLVTTVDDSSGEQHRGLHGGAARRSVEEAGARRSDRSLCQDSIQQGCKRSDNVEKRIVKHLSNMEKATGSPADQMTWIGASGPSELNLA